MGKQKRRVRLAGSLPGHAESLGDAVADDRSGVSLKEKRRRLHKEQVVKAEKVSDDEKVEAEDVEDEQVENYLDAATTRRVLKQAREQLKETENRGSKPEKVEYDLSSDEGGEDEEEEPQDEFDDADEIDYLDDTQITAEDERALAMFGMGEGPRQTLADIIMDKLQEAERREEDKTKPIDPMHIKIKEVYAGVGEVMRRYTAGKVPKAFKLIPTRLNWEELLWRTNPDKWSPAAVYVATRTFTSNLDAKQVQIYYHDVLLSRARDDIAQNRKLHFSIYQSLKKALFKPKPFFKGIIFPLSEDPSCTLREAMIFGSVLAKVSIPMLHSAAALLRLASMPFSGATSIFIRVLLDKKYALPYRVVDALVDHFTAMEDDTRVLPVLWQQSLLTFSQRYKTLITREQKNRLKVVMKVHFHPGITPEIRRELFSVRSRGEHDDPDANTIAMEIENAA